MNTIEVLKQTLKYLDKVEHGDGEENPSPYAARIMADIRQVIEQEEQDLLDRFRERYK